MLTTSLNPHGSERLEKLVLNNAADWAREISIDSTALEPLIIINFAGIFSKNWLIICPGGLFEMRVKKNLPIKCNRRLEYKSIDWKVYERLAELYITICDSDGERYKIFGHSEETRNELKRIVSMITSYTEGKQLTYNTKTAFNTLKRIILGEIEDTLFGEKWNEYVNQLVDSRWLAYAKQESTKQLTKSLISLICDTWGSILNGRIKDDLKYVLSNYSDLLSLAEWWLKTDDDYKYLTETITTFEKERLILVGAKSRGPLTSIAKAGATALASASLGTLRADKAIASSSAVATLKNIDSLIETLRAAN